MAPWIPRPCRELEEEEAGGRGVLVYPATPWPVVAIKGDAVEPAVLACLRFVKDDIGDVGDVALLICLDPDALHGAQSIQMPRARQKLTGA